MDQLEVAGEVGGWVFSRNDVPLQSPVPSVPQSTADVQAASFCREIPCKGYNVLWGDREDRVEHLKKTDGIRNVLIDYTGFTVRIKAYLLVSKAWTTQKKPNMREMTGRAKCLLLVIRNNLVSGILLKVLGRGSLFKFMRLLTVWENCCFAFQSGKTRFSFLRYELYNRCKKNMRTWKASCANYSALLGRDISWAQHNRGYTG